MIMPKPLLDDNGLDRRPHNITPDFWFYEELDGLHILYKGASVGVIPWRSLRASLNRKDKVLK